jgi:hypothetical protein
MSDIFQSSTFWSAFGALIAFAGLVVTITGLIVAFLKGTKWKRLQKTLDNERRFYEEQARRVQQKPIRLPEESIIDQYLNSIEKGLLSIDALKPKERSAIKDRLSKLISELRTTHATLVENLKLFTTDDVKDFINNFNVLNQNFGAVYDAGNIPDNARTHCTAVLDILQGLESQLETTSAQIQGIINIRYSMEYADEDIIVPMMTYILSKAEVELSLIGSAIRERKIKKAIWLKERYRFDIKNFYQRLDDALIKMRELSNKL